MLDRKLIRKRYLMSWFGLDFVAIFPFELFALMAEGGSGGNLGVLGILKLPRLLRLGRVLKMMDKLSAANAIRIVYLLTFCVLISHWLACIWWLVGKLVYDYDQSREDDEHNGHGTSWLSRVAGNNVLSEDSTLPMKYATSWYWALTMLMKTPFVGPDALAEKLFASVAVVLGAILFAGLLGNVTALMQSFGVQDRMLREKIAGVRNFCAKMEVPAALEKKLGEYVDAHWSMSHGIDDLGVLSQLPGQLQSTIVMAMYRESLMCTQLFSKCSKECSAQLLLRLRPQARRGSLAAAAGLAAAACRRPRRRCLPLPHALLLLRRRPSPAGVPHQGEAHLDGRDHLQRVRADARHAAGQPRRREEAAQGGGHAQ